MNTEPVLVTPFHPQKQHQVGNLKSKGSLQAVWQPLPNTVSYFGTLWPRWVLSGLWDGHAQRRAQHLGKYNLCVCPWGWSLRHEFVLRPLAWVHEFCKHITVSRNENPGGGFWCFSSSHIRKKDVQLEMLLIFFHRSQHPVRLISKRQKSP